MLEERFESLLADRWKEVDEAIDESRRLLKGRVVWHVNSTARGGGVRERSGEVIGDEAGGEAGVSVRGELSQAGPDVVRQVEAVDEDAQ